MYTYNSYYVQANYLINISKTIRYTTTDIMRYKRLKPHTRLCSRIQFIRKVEKGKKQKGLNKKKSKS